MSETVRVTAEHITRGNSKDGGSCPIALAVKENSPDDLVWVAEVLIAITRSGHDFEARLPPPASQFVNAFDRGQPVEPFEFEVTWEEWRAHL